MHGIVAAGPTFQDAVTNAITIINEGKNGD